MQQYINISPYHYTLVFRSYRYNEYHNIVGCKKFPEFCEMFTNICKHFANVHLYLHYITYVHEQYHKLLLKVCELGGNFCIPPTPRYQHQTVMLQLYIIHNCEFYSSTNYFRKILTS